MIKECISIWGEKPKRKEYKMTKGEQQEFEFAKKTPEECMKEISEDSKKQLYAILDEILARGSYEERDIKNIVNCACWIER